MRTFKVGDRVVTEAGEKGKVIHVFPGRVDVKIEDKPVQGWHPDLVYLEDSLHLILWDFICECAESFEKNIGKIAGVMAAIVVIAAVCAVTEANRELKCKDRWSSSGFDVQYLYGQCMVGVNKRYFPEDNIKVSTSAIEVDYE